MGPFTVCAGRGLVEVFSAVACQVVLGTFHASAMDSEAVGRRMTPPLAPPALRSVAFGFIPFPHAFGVVYNTAVLFT